MSDKIVVHPRVSKWAPSDWTPAQRAYIEDVAALLKSSGVIDEVEWGGTERGDPWVAFLAAPSYEAKVAISKVGTTLAVHMNGDPDPVAVGDVLMEVIREALGVVPIPLLKSRHA